MDGKKSISNLFSYANVSPKNTLTESESRKHSICTIYNGKNCLTPCYDYPYYTPNLQSFSVIEEDRSIGIKNNNNNSLKEVEKMKYSKKKCSGFWTLLFIFLIISSLLGSAVYLKMLNIPHFIHQKFETKHFYRE